MIKDIVISRTYGLKQTTGALVVFDGDRVVLQLKALELPQLGNAQSISCMPAGIYKAIKYNRPKGKGWCLWLQDVPQRTAILVHAGNFAAGSKVDTEGCILVGLRFEDINGDGSTDVADSTKALATLLALVPNEVKITIL